MNMDRTGGGAVPNDLSSFWVPFTPNRAFKAAPRLLVSARDMHYTSHDGRRILDGCAGLWCVNAGHGRPEIVEAIQRKVADFAFGPSFNVSHPDVFRLAGRVADLMPGDLNRIFFTNSGSEAVDTALKIALACHRVRGDGARTRLIGRERGYHGVGFGGISVGGMVNNRKTFGPLLNGVDHLPHTHNLEHNAFCRGQPEWGAHLADDLERIVALHDASTIAAVIVEPMAGSTGALPPPKGYLRRLREICDRHDLLLIFDEVITAWGRLGAATASEYFGVTPDIITMAKGLTSGYIPMGAVAVREGIYDAFMHGPEHVIELFHGYTYTGHPVAAAAGLATLDVYARDNLFAAAAALAPALEAAVHSLKDAPGITDIRNLGLVAALDLAPGDQAGQRGMAVFRHCYDNGVLLRLTGDTIAIAPPLIADTGHIDEIVTTLETAIRAHPA